MSSSEEAERPHLPHMPRRDDTLEIRIEALDVRGGEGVARWPVLLGPQRDVRTLKVSVRNALPGERVRARVDGVRRGQVSAGLDALLEPSPQRIEPRCRHFGRREEDGRGCGGCTLQALPYEAQLEHKQALVESSLRGAGLDAASLGVAVAPILPCASPWFYRNKMEFSFGHDRAGRFALGLHPAGYRHEILRLEECWLESPEAAALVRAARDFAAANQLEPYRQREETGWLRSLTVREGKRTGERLLVLTTSHEARVQTAAGEAAADEVARAFAAHLVEVAAGLGAALDGIVHERHRAVRGERTRFEHTTLHGRDVLFEALELASGQRLRFEIHARAFFQPNTRQAELLYGLVASGGDAAGLVLDLYCGTGTIGLCLAPTAGRVIGVELQADAVENARRNAALNGLEDKVEFIAGDVGAVLGGALAEVVAARGVERVVVDPPRAGLMAEALGHLTALAAPHLVYVSCNPEALGRDLARLTRGGGYRIESIQPVDMFPQTGHVETVVHLRRRET